MKVNVVYCSMTGHSKKIANAVAKELGVTAINIKGNPTLEKTDVLFVVGGVYSGESLPAMIAFAKTIKTENVGKVALITSSASNKKGQDGIRKVMTENDVMVSIDECRVFGNFLFLKMGHPNKKDVETAVSFAKKFIVS